MTAVMRAMPQATGPKVLRIGLVPGPHHRRAHHQAAHERHRRAEREVDVRHPERTSPPQFKLFELIGGDYYLNFLDGMTGRVALATGITDSAALKGQAKRVGQRLPDPAHRGGARQGRHRRDDVPLPVRRAAAGAAAAAAAALGQGGLASQIDWSLTIIAAFSFLLHFGAGRRDVLATGWTRSSTTT